MKNYTIIKEENTKWDEQKKIFFSEVDENIFRIGKVSMNASSVDYIYWAAIDDAGEVLGYAWLYRNKEVSVCVKVGYRKYGVGTSLLNEVARFAKERGFSKLVAIVESENENAVSVVKWFYKLEYQWEIVDEVYMSLNQTLQAVEKKHDSIYLSRKI